MYAGLVTETHPLVAPDALLEVLVWWRGSQIRPVIPRGNRHTQTQQKQKKTGYNSTTCPAGLFSARQKTFVAVLTAERIMAEAKCQMMTYSEGK